MFKKIKRKLKFLNLKWFLSDLKKRLLKMDEVLLVKFVEIKRGKSAEIRILVKEETLQVKRNIIKEVYSEPTRFNFYLLIVDKKSWDILEEREDRRIYGEYRRKGIL
jgi:hypothetical protein